MLTVGGINWTAENIQNGTYVIQRPFVLVTNNAAPLTEAAQTFFDYMTSADSDEQNVVAGAVPMAHE